MGWKTSAALLTLSFLGLGSLVYLLYNKDEEDDNCMLFQSSKTTVVEVKVPKEIIGIIIGRGGQTLKEIETQSDTTIKVKDDSTTGLKICVIKGTPECAQFAECLIHKIIVSQPLIETLEMYIPESACGRVIGKGGESIRMICRSSNAKLSLENVSKNSPKFTERKLTIKGTPEQIALAKAMVEQKVEEEIAFRNKLEDQAFSRPSSNKAKYLLPSKGENEDANSFKYQEKFVATGSNGLLEVYVSALQDPDHIWLQMIGPCTIDLDRLNEQMSEYYSNDENKERHKLKEVKCGQIVAAPFVYDNKWYRAEVLDVRNRSESEEPIVGLYYVDYGDQCTYESKEIYELRTDFLRLRFQAVECKLAKIKPRGSAWTEDAIDLLDDLTHVALWKSLMARIHTYEERPTKAKREGSPVPCIELFDTSGKREINVAEELVEKGFAVWEKCVESSKED